jgi:hypothetical protein
MFPISQDRAKRIAKSLASELKNWSFKKPYTVVLEITAEMLEYKNWIDLIARSTSDTIPPWDEDQEEAVVASRIEHQIRVLVKAGVPETVSREIIGKIRPTSNGALDKSQVDKAESAGEPGATPYDVALVAFEAQDYKKAHDIVIAELGSKGQVPSKVHFFDLLERMIPYYPIAKANHALAMVYGDGCSKNVTEGENTLIELMDHPALDVQTRSTVLNVLGDIARGAHGGSVNRQRALELYLRSGRELHSAMGAFNAGEFLLQDNLIDEAAEMYRIGAEAGHPTAMFKYAVMMIEGEIAGDPDEMERFMRGAAAKGNPHAKQALPNIKMYREGVAFANTMTGIAMSAFRSK